jgi:hypothetical protein
MRKLLRTAALLTALVGASLVGTPVQAGAYVEGSSFEVMQSGGPYSCGMLIDNGQYYAAWAGTDSASPHWTTQCWSTYSVVWITSGASAESTSSSNGDSYVALGGTLSYSGHKACWALFNCASGYWLLYQ